MTPAQYEIYEPAIVEFFQRRISQLLCKGYSHSVKPMTLNAEGNNVKKRIKSAHAKP
jgi:hypothetical protein